MEQGKIDTSQDPIQTTTDQEDIIILEIEDGVFELRPIAQYKASVMVMSKESREEKEREARIKLNDFKNLQKKYRGDLQELEKKLVSELRDDTISLVDIRKA